MSHTTRTHPPRRRGGIRRPASGMLAQPVMHARPTRGTIVRARVALALCIALWLLYMTTAIVTLSRGGALVDVWHLLGTTVFLVSVAMLTFSACMYLLARAGALPRFAAHRRARRADIDAAFEQHPARVLALLPSYAEDPALVRMGLWSAALQEAPGLRVVLLLDDPPVPAGDPAADRLERTRHLTAEITEGLAPIRERAQGALDTLADDDAPGARCERVASVYADAAQWLHAMAAAEPRGTHVEAFFAERVIGALADDLAASADALRGACADEDAAMLPERAAQLLRRVLWIFSADLDVFERKRYSSLSHEPNKAMNLNAYLGLVGGRHRLRVAAATASSRGAQERYEVVDVPECDFVLTLDADSMLLPDYAARLVHELGRPGNERVAVIQTPYSAYRGARSRLEQLAGATTDLQHIVHQGLTAFSATFWVGANALIRRSALEDLRTVDVEDGVAVVRFIRGETVIEDTEASIDIVAHGWTLVNYPERLSYSTTPPDFGTLVIQRRRWANGGLLVLPRLHRLAVARRASGRPLRLAERLLRANYLGSITWVTLGLLVLLTVVPLNGELVSAVLLLIALPYFVEMAHDLQHLGYRRRDVIGVYGLNLLLVAVNLAGTLGSIAQAFSGSKAAFARTPKAHTRTPAGALYVLAPLAIGVGAVVVAVRAAGEGAWVATGFASLTALCVLWAMVRLIGVRNGIRDVWNGWLEWIWVAAPARTAASAQSVLVPAWRSVLDDGALEPAPVAR